ncbi:MAG: hypothetical protein P8M72_04745 [Gammaproteobacteria bacterium]|nr:hypothetical protein [Gammaproteobacteria bacterium]
MGFLVVLVIATTIYKITSLKHSKKGSSKEFKHMLAEELVDRDDKANALEERLRVVEKIVTDNHTSSVLSDEIDNLKEK